MQQISPTLEILLARFDGAILIPFVVGARIIGTPPGTARNQLCAGTFPIKTVLRGSRRFIHVVKLAYYVDSLVEETALSAEKKRGKK